MPAKRKLDPIQQPTAVFYAYHGVLTDEQNLGGKFEIDVDLACDLRRGGKSDHLKDTVDYVLVYETIRSAVLGKRTYLLEALGEAIATNLLKKFRRVREVTVRVRKPSVPIRGVVDTVEVELHRNR